MAPEAELVVVASITESVSLVDLLSYANASIPDAASYIYQFAEHLGRPAVINLSQRHELTPHDGSSLEELLLDRLIAGGTWAFVRGFGRQ